MVLDFNPHVYESTVKELTVAGQQLFFTASGPGGRDLWVSDGTAEGTRVVRRFNASRWGPGGLVVVGDQLTFLLPDGARTALWWSDGTSRGTRAVSDPPVWALDRGGAKPTSYAVYRGAFYFAGGVRPRDNGLWRSEGAARTALLKDIHPTESNLPSALTPALDALFFAADNGAHGNELWRSDGTTAGTQLLADIHKGGPNAGSDPQWMLGEPDGLWFQATDDATGAELWRSDGTAAGTVRVMDIVPGPAGSSPQRLTRSGRFVYFAVHVPIDEASPSHLADCRLWRSDGTANGTQEIADICPAVLADYHGTAVIYGEDRDGFGIWRSDGTPEGTAKLAALPGPW
jgi:large repetitive protein